MFKLKSASAISYHLTCYFFRDNNIILYFAPKKQVKKIASSHETVLRCKSIATVHSPLEKRYYLELETLEFLDIGGTKKASLLLIPCNRLFL